MVARCWWIVLLSPAFTAGFLAGPSKPGAVTSAASHTRSLRMSTETASGKAANRAQHGFGPSWISGLHQDRPSQGLFWLYSCCFMRVSGQSGSGAQRRVLGLGVCGVGRALRCEVFSRSN